MEIKGTLIPIGGNEDKGIDKNEKYTLEYIEDGILARVVKEAGGADKMILIVPTASSIPAEIIEIYLSAFQKLGCKNLEVMDIRNRKDAEKSEYLELVKKADCILFSGGDQSKIVRYIGGTEIHDTIIKRYHNEHFVIAGTSAGAMCMSHEMITGGSSTEAFVKGAVSMGQGMSFVPSLIIDSHFIRRGRFGRLAEAVAKYPKLVGVGLAEDTGLVIKNNNHCEVIGSGMIILFNPRKLKHNNEKSLSPNSPMSLNNLVTHILVSGDEFEVKKRKLKISPIHAKKEKSSK
jgi:cyanophycinase